MILTKTTIKAKAAGDVWSVCKSLYRLNAPHRIGYLFNLAADEKSVWRGMFCDSEQEIDPERWDYFFNTTDQQVYRISA
jgi:hypothetical protein